MSKPYSIADVVTPALGGIVRALSDPGALSDAEREAKGDAVMSVILAFQPRDAIELTLSGQTVLFTELLADTARDVLRGMADGKKQQSLSLLVSLGRLAQGHVDRLERLGNRPHQAEVAMPPAVGAEIVGPRMLAVPADVAGGLPAGELVAETSWLDEPFAQWVIDAPADAGAVRDARDLDVRGGWPKTRPGPEEPALPRQPAEYSRARLLEDAAAGNGVSSGEGVARILNPAAISPTGAALARRNVAASTRQRL